MLFGVFASHSPESCPLNDANSKKIFLEIDKKLQNSIKKHNIEKIVGFYMSVLEHQWIIILDANNAHDIETMCIDVGISATSTVKIVPLNEFSKVIKRLTAK
ncbi:MAG: hypothetical protein EB150_00290 [Nitrososphaeria archaeon]|nr:hypothetical protein [Nitrososphaeria archaeon]NDB51392.1 hypothetical protein [Nitrosopumilaceae archaeon]NDB87777.1 hypothetical protein [Nitrososphaerota archaeon]NDB45763.1 hypothetical protein [Nitrososphaeria archaeon]NDB62424.1 hypothetical protein [Nitrosopumilaceae archaeon]